MKDFKDFTLKMLVGLFVILGGVLLLIGMVQLFLYFDFSIFYITMTSLLLYVHMYLEVLLLTILKTRNNDLRDIGSYNGVCIIYIHPL